LIDFDWEISDLNDAVIFTLLQLQKQMRSPKGKGVGLEVSLRLSDAKFWICLDFASHVHYE
jgi:hypothetical protein